MAGNPSFLTPGSRTVLTGALVMALCSASAASTPVTEDVPVPGGTIALARAIGIEAVPDRGLFVAEVARFLNWRPTLHGVRDSMVQRLVAYFETVGPRDATRGGQPVELVPMPLPAVVWSQAVFHRPVVAADLFAAVMSDSEAALLARGLAALDDQTLQFLIDHPVVITRLYEHAADVFSAFAAHLHVHDNRVVPPGGDRAVPLWEALLHEKVAQPDRFIAALFAKHRGRLAYLYDTIGHLDPSRAAFALGLWIEDPARRADRFKALASAAASAFPEWSAQRLYFRRPTQDFVSMFMRVQVEPSGAPRFPASRVVWERAFDAGDAIDEKSLELLNVGGDSPIDAGWLAETILTEKGAVRLERLDQLAFGQRAFAADAASLPDVIVAVHALPRFRMLMLTLDRIGVRRASLYAALARHAQRLSRLDRSRAATALAQFQGAIAIVARLAKVGTIDAARAEALLATLAAVPLNQGRYMGGVAEWMRVELRPVLPPGDNVEDALIHALAGASGAVPVSLITWEGAQYRFDLATSEARRLRRLRQYQGGPSIDSALENLAKIRQSSETSEPQLSHSLFELVDVVLGEAVRSISYAVDLSVPTGAERFAGSVARRHDFGLAKNDEELRVRAAWAVPRQVLDEGAPWHVEGALLGLDAAFGSLALRRIEESPPRKPAMNSLDRDTFTLSFALMNAFALQDAGGDAIADAVGRGQRRIEALGAGNGDLTTLADEIEMDGWRRRAVGWTIAHDPQRTRSFFSMSELVYLGGGRGLDINAWGTSALATVGCLCTEVTAPRLWTALIGRAEVGVLSAAVADLNLHVAVMLHEMRLPAPLAKPVLAYAVRDFLDHVSPSDADDWLTLVRTAQGVSRERVEDYVAAAAADGALVPDTTTNPPREP